MIGARSYMGKRLILLAGYLAFSEFWSFAFSGAGDGSPGPMEAFYSWGLLFAYFNNYNPVGCLVSYIVFLFILFIFTTFLSWQKVPRGDLALIGIYLFGSILNALIMGPGVHVSLITFLFHFIVFAVVVVFYLVIDWRLAKDLIQLRRPPCKGISS